MLARLRREQSGFGLVELLIAMMVLSIGLLAVVAAFTSGSVALQRASKVSTASVIADAQMERYRALRYQAIALLHASVEETPVGGHYRTDSTIAGDLTKLYTEAVCPSGAPAQACTASRTTTGPDNRPYRVDTYISKGVQIPDEGTSAAARELKVVTVVVRDERDGMKTLIREQSTFDLATGR